MCGSAPLRPELATRALRQFGPVLFNLYGSSEGGIISLARPEHLIAAPDSVGRVLPGLRLTVRRPDGTPAPPDEVGHLCVCGDMTQGVSSSGTQELDTGDLGRLSPGGFLFLAGRRDDLLNCGGEKVRPEEVEARIATLPYVLDCAVAGVPSEEYGQALVAYVALTPGQPEMAGGVVAAQRLQADLAALLPRSLRPVKVIFLPELPRTPLGKLLRHRLPSTEAIAAPEGCYE